MCATLVSEVGLGKRGGGRALEKTGLREELVVERRQERKSGKRGSGIKSARSFRNGGRKYAKGYNCQKRQDEK